jgi:hypothetical protein
MGGGCSECCEGSGEAPVVVTCSVGLSAPRPAQSVGPTVALTTLKPGQTALVRRTEMDAGDADLLRAMGLRMEARVRLCRLGEPCIVEVMGGGESCGRAGGCVCRIGLARPLAEKVLVGSVEGG